MVFIFSGSIGVQAEDYSSYFNSMLKFVQEMYYKDLTDEEGLKAAISGLLSGLDRYSAFFDREELEAYTNSINGNYVGIGAGLEKSGTYIKINKIYEGSPAEKAGIHEGDIITSVDGKSVEGMEAEDAAANIRGDEGTAVRISVLRADKKLEFSVVRGIVSINPVQYRLEGKKAYIRIDSFGSGTAANFGRAMAEVDKNEIKRIILDLRGNPGGYVDEAVEVAKKLIPPGVITTLDYKSEAMPDKVYYSDEKHPDYIVAVLTDENTASASEILAGALEDAGNGFLIGQKTFGKGVFQNMFNVLTPEAYKKYSELYGSEYISEIEWLSYEGVAPKEDEILGAAKITTGHYLTPKGRTIDGIGLKPLIELPDAIFPNDVDLSLVKALANSVDLTVSSYNDEVYNAEKILRASGYFSETADRQFDSKTQEAVKKYQAEKKLPVTGNIDLKTREQMNRTLSDLININDKQYSKALEILSWFK
jgi:carboxyl-terminal processing protease